MYFLLWDSLSKNVVDIFRTIMLVLSTFVCELIIFAADIFVRLGKAEFLTSTQVETIYSRITLILGIFMLFKMLFSFIQYLINPDTMSDKSKGAGKLITKAVVVVALLGLTPFIFKEAYNLQNFILDSNIIGKVITAKDSDSGVSDFGTDLASYLFLSFYSPTTGVDIGERCPKLGDNMDNLRDEIQRNHTFSLAQECLNESLEDNSLSTHKLSEGYLIEFRWNGIALLISSVAVVYILISYCLSVGTRVIQLAFLQLIAPIPIISYLGEDKEGAFSKWVKRCVSTFLDLFIRMVIIYFVVFVINLILGDSDSYYLFLSTTDNPEGLTKILLNVILILGLLMFAKKAPELLKELLPQGIGNNIGFGFKDTNRILGGAKRGVGFVGGATVGAGMSGISRFNINRKAGNDIGKSLLGAAGGVVSGSITGATNGVKKGNMFKNIGAGVKARTTADNRYNELITSGGTTFGSFQSRVVDKVGETKGQMYTRRIRDLEAIKKHKDGMNNAAYNITAVKNLKTAYENMIQRDGESIQEFNLRKQAAYGEMKEMRNAAQEAAIAGADSFTYNGNTYNFDEDDRAYASQIRSEVQQAETYRKSHNVQYLNDSGNWVELKPIRDRKSLSATEAIFNDTQAKVSASRDYASSLANDRYANVNSNKEK